MPPKVIARNNDRASGVLPVNAAARAAPHKTSATRLKLEIRRLPPNLTLTEFEEILGDEWKLGNGKVDWREYRQGKIKAPGKIPEQSRCYIHLTNEAAVKDFEQRFLAVVFHDKAGTHKNAELKHLPPTLGFAPSQRTPLQVKQRADNRQGTIDQDPEFIAFLEAETQPITKPSAVEVTAADKEREVVKSTPLIDDLREKKANKAKAAATKADKKKDDDKKVPAHGRSESKDVAAEKGVKTGQQGKVEQAAKDAVKALNKQAAGKQMANVTVQQGAVKGVAPVRPKKQPQSPRAANATPAQAVTTANTGPPSPAPNRGPPGARPRGNAEGIKKMLQKDLGIKPKPTTNSPATQPAVPTSTIPTASSTAQSLPPPTALKSSNPPKSSISPAPTPPSFKAYLKHANPSQGMTEMLILRSLSQFGDLSNVTIDPRKGTAIAAFKDAEGLRKAIEARQVPVANGAVEVLEFREVGGRARGGLGGGRGGFRGGRGGARGGAGGAGIVATPTPGSAA